MKKVIGFMMVAVFALAFVACGNKAAQEAAEKAKADSTKAADSIAAVVKQAAEQAAAQAKADSVAAQAKADSIAAATKKKK